MIVQFSIVGMEHPPNPPKVWMEAIPQVGDLVVVPEVPIDKQFVRTVEWLPYGDPDSNDSPAAFVYIVLGPRRKQL